MYLKNNDNIIDLRLKVRDKMKIIKLFTIDKCYKPKELYRYNIEFEDGASIGSCFCYDSFREAYQESKKI